jgi:hypothetical protein
MTDREHSAEADAAPYWDTTAHEELERYERWQRFIDRFGCSGAWSANRRGIGDGALTHAADLVDQAITQSDRGAALPDATR